jgi:DHA1 family inner membrane transport protein
MRLPPMVLVILLLGCGPGAAAQFGKISVLFEDLRAIYGGQGAAALGLIVSVVGMVGLVFGTTAGFWWRASGRGGPSWRRWRWARASAVQALLPPYPVMLAASVVEGLSHLAIVVVGPTMIAALAPEAQRPLAMTLWSSFFGVTYALLALIAPGIVAAGGAPGLFLAHAAWMAGLGLVLARALPLDPVAIPGRMAGLAEEHRRIYASPRLAAPAMGFCFYTFLYVACLTLLPPEVPLAQRALMATGMPLISIAVSLTLGVWLLGRMSAVRLVQFGYAAAVPGFVLLWLGWGQGGTMLAGGLWLSAALGIVQGASFAAIPELNATPEDRARAAGAIAQLGNLGTTTGTPVLAALLAVWGAGAMTLVAVVFCLAGIGVHSLQARRRQLRST